jgi:hypothetical protein
MFVGITIVLGLVFFRPVLAWWRQWGGLAGLWRESGSFERAVAVVLGFFISAALLIALAPPLKWDALVYHLVLPQAYLDLGRLAYLPWIIKSGHPQNIELLYAWAMTIGGAPAAAVLGWLAGVTALAGLLGYLHQHFGLRPAWVGTAAVVSGYSVASALAWAYVDWWGLFLGLGALVTLGRWRMSGRWGELALAGTFAGMALATKYPAGVLGAAALAALGWHIWKRRAALLPSVSTFGLSALVFPLPWIVKNWVTTGNPFYPLFFEGGAMNAVRTEVYTHTPPFGNLLDILILPVRATYLGLEGREGYASAIGPLLLAFGALAWAGWPRAADRESDQRIVLENALAFSLAALLVWAVGNQFSGFLIQSRFYFSIFPAFAVLAAAGFSGIRRLSLPQVRVERIAAALVLLALGLNAVEVGKDLLASGAAPVVAGLQSQEEYLTENLGWHAQAMQAVRDLPDGAQVLLLNEPRSFYCRPTCSPDETMDRWRRDWLHLEQPEAVLGSWRDAGFTHVLFYRAGAEFMRDTRDLHHTEDEWQALFVFIDTLPEEADFGGVYQLYRIRIE